MFVLRGLPILIELALLIYCLIDAIQTPPERIRNLPKWGWIVLIIVFPLVGAIAWLVAGRPSRSAPAAPSGPPADGARRRGPLAPDDDPEFLAQLRAVDREQARTLDSWEADLRRREEELRRRRTEDDPQA